MPCKFPRDAVKRGLGHRAGQMQSLGKGISLVWDRSSHHDLTSRSPVPSKRPCIAVWTVWGCTEIPQGTDRTGIMLISIPRIHYGNCLILSPPRTVCAHGCEQHLRGATLYKAHLKKCWVWQGRASFETGYLHENEDNMMQKTFLLNNFCLEVFLNHYLSWNNNISHSE